MIYSHVRFLAIIGTEDDQEKISDLWQTIKDYLWSCFSALRNHINRFKPLDEEKYKHFREILMVGMNDHEARQALEVELEKCYNNRFNAARSYYYKLQQTIVS